MDVTQAAPAPAPSTRTDPAPPATALSSDFETFLRMLTVQMQNQDPLNPIESSDFAVQLATFSGVEQQVRTNDLLGGLSRGLAAGGIAQFSAWVGMEARTAAPRPFDGTPVALDIVPRQGADGARLIARDQSGRIVDDREVPVGGGTYLWDGRSPLGQSYLAGEYSFTLQSYAGEDLIAERAVEGFRQVREVRTGPEGAEIVFSDGVAAKADAVTALRAAGS